MYSFESNIFYFYFILRFIQVVGCFSSASLFIAEWYSTAQMYHDLFSHSPVDGHSGCFQIGVIMNIVDMKIYVQVFVWTYGFNYQVNNRSGLAGP